MTEERRKKLEAQRCLPTDERLRLMRQARGKPPVAVKTPSRPDGKTRRSSVPDVDPADPMPHPVTEGNIAITYFAVMFNRPVTEALRSEVVGVAEFLAVPVRWINQALYRVYGTAVFAFELHGCANARDWDAHTIVNFLTEAGFKPDSNGHSCMGEWYEGELLSPAQPPSAA